MKIFAAEKIREIDAYTIEHEPIPSIDLMERASNAFVQWFVQRFPFSERSVMVFCGMGNNGGDGLAISRLLFEQGYSVQVFACRFSKKSSPDFQANEERLKQHLDLVNIEKAGDLPEIPADALVIDAIFGSGLSRAAKGIAGKLIDHLNAYGATIIAVDIPSGLYADQANEPTDSCIHATHTVSFQMPKLAFMLPENADMVGEWHLVDIGLSEEAIRQFETPFHFTDRQAAKLLLKKRDKFAHKGNFGHLLVAAGSKGKMGAAVLAVQAALRTGAGLVTAFVPECGYQVMQVSAPAAMCLTDPSDNFLTELPHFEKATAVAIGPGMGLQSITQNALGEWLQQNRQPTVIDADGLNILAQNPKWLANLPAQVVLTPHPKEFERLVGKTANEFERLEKLRQFSQENRAVVVLKGAHTAVGLPDGSVHFNATGNPGMATGGSGDVLTGIIGALLAGPYSPAEAAILGVYLHGLAGDLAAEKKGFEALIAPDITDSLGSAFRQLYV